MAVDIRQMPETRMDALGFVETTHAYYRQPDGRIKPAPVGKISNGRGSDQIRYEAQGWTMLKQYGRFNFAFDEYYLERPLEVLFIRGGAHELTLEQIQSEGMHINPPTIPWCQTVQGQEHAAKYGSKKHGPGCYEHMVPVELPQLQDVTVVIPSGCDFCERDDFATDKARAQHMRVMHKEELNALRSAENIAEALAKVSPATQQMVQSDKYVCGRCGDGFTAINKLGEHMKLHEEQSE